MNKYLLIPIITSLILILSFQESSAQYASKKVRPKHKAYEDSLRNVDYNYIFPIFGQGAYKKGFDIPYPAGAMVNFMWMKQNIVIDNMQLGLQTQSRDIPLTDVNFIEFGDNTNTSMVTNIRPDLWLFPFLNVYGIFGYGNSNTEVNLVKPFGLKSIVSQSVRTAGFGVMSAVGLGPVWLSVDYNMTWNKPELLDKSVNVNVAGVRFGHTFTFTERPDRNIALWVGGMYTNMSSGTKGSIKLIDAIPAETWNKRDQLVTDYRYWYDNEATLVQKKTADKILTPIVDKIDEADGESVIRYGMDKQVKQNWNFIVGAQFQFNKRWMFRTEGGVIGNRKSLLISLNYRFLI